MPDWEAILNEVRCGVLTDAEIARRHGVDTYTLHRRILAAGIVSDLQSRVVAETRRRMNIRLLEDRELVGSAAERAVAITESHFSTTRALRVRANKLLASFDEMVAGFIDAEGNVSETIPAKQLPGSTQVLHELTKLLERIHRMELAIYGVALGGDAPPDTAASIGHGIDAMEAARQYQKLMNG